MSLKIRVPVELANYKMNENKNTSNSSEISNQNTTEDSSEADKLTNSKRSKHAFEFSSRNYFVGDVFRYIVIPSISVGFGTLVLFQQIENGITQPQLWDSSLVYTSLFLIISSTICAPLCRLLIVNSTWPRLVATAGTCLTCAGVLLIWTTIFTNHIVVYSLAGILAGAGACIILTQTDVILSQYFKVKIELIRTIIYIAEAVGFIIIPITLGGWIVKHGMLHIITWYQAVILQGIIFSIAFKKPPYLKSSKKRYKLIRGLSDEEEDVFAKNATELQQPRSSEGTSANENVQRVVNAKQTNDSPNAPNAVPKNWETFEEESSKQNAKVTKTQKELHESFATEFAKDLDKNNTFEDDYVELPKPLFSEPHINNNISYAYETTLEVNAEPIVFMPNEKPERINNVKKVFDVLKEPTFYKTLILFVTTKYTTFVFWTLFPTYLYIKIDHVKIHEVPNIVGSVGIGSLIFAPLLNWIKSNRKTRPIFLWIFCWMAAIGYIILDTSNKTLFIFGAFVIILGINALHILGYPLTNVSQYGEQSSHFLVLNVIAGLLLAIFLLIDISYATCFQLMSILNFLTGSLWLVNFLYKKLKN